MALINGVIPNMYDGVSQQPPASRNPAQCQAMDNCYPTIATGMRKRPATHHIAKLRSTTATDGYIHMINRDTAERYIVVILDGDLEVYNLAGVAQTVSFPDGKTYLSATVPRTSFKVVTIADYSFIVNTSVVTAMDTTTSGAAITDTVQTFADLPATSTTGFVYKIQGDDIKNYDDYYVKWDSDVYVETIAPAQETLINATTMPHTLVRNADGTFTFSKQVWDSRLVGSTLSNPNPSFIGQAIKGIFFHRDRLGVHAGESVVMTRAGLYFNFFRKTTTALLDDDPIDIQVSHTKVSNIRHVVPFNKTLLMFSDQTQFQLTATDSLTSKTVATEVVTEFEISQECEPVGLGNSVYFASDKETFSAVREYFVDNSTITNDAADVTAHCPFYLPNGLFQLVASSTEDVVMALSTEERNAVYVYKVYWSVDDKVQSSWGRYLLPTTDTILGLSFIASTLYLVIQRADGIYLEESHLQHGYIDTPLTYQVLLDRQTSLTGVYNSVTDVTTWTLPFADAGDYSIIKGGSWTVAAGAKLNTTRNVGDTTIEAVGDFSAHPCLVGRKYDMLYTFSEQFVRDSGGIAIQSGNLVMKNMRVDYSDSGYFQVEVTPRARDTNTYKFTGGTLGDISTTIGKVGISTGSFSFFYEYLPKLASGATFPLYCT